MPLDSYFYLACIRFVSTMGFDNHRFKQQVIKQCKNKYERGVSVILVNKNEVGNTFTPTKTTPMSAVFLNYERLEKEYGAGLAPSVLVINKQAISTYNPDTELLFLFVNNQPGGEVYLFTL